MKPITDEEYDWINEQIVIYRACKKEDWKDDDMRKIELEIRGYCEIEAEEMYKRFANDDRDYEIARHDIDIRLWLEDIKMYMRQELMASAIVRKVHQMAKRI